MENAGRMWHFIVVRTRGGVSASLARTEQLHVVIRRPARRDAGAVLPLSMIAGSLKLSPYAN